jgi:hypothetical protein
MKNKLIIIGSAPCATEDFYSCLDRIGNIRLFNRDFDAMAIGLDAVDRVTWPLKYVATNHVEDIPAIRQRREKFQGNINYQLVSYKPHPGVDIVQPLGPVSGSSAILGALSGITLGYKKIILCGCPLTGNAPEGNPYEAFRPGWVAQYESVKDKVRSMSGWTRELLGAPTADWLARGDRITVGCCWDGRDYYSPEYVNILYRSVSRNTTAPFDFVLYTGPDAEKPGRTASIDPAIRIVPIGRPAWWSALSFWEKNPPGVDTDNILYLDLDLVIVGSLDDLIAYPSDHAFMKDYPAHCCPPGLEGDGNASVSLIRSGAGAQIWDGYVAAGMPTWDPLSAPVGRKLPLAVQTLINDPLLGIRHDVFPENWVSSHRLHVVPRGIPEGCRVISYHGRPKPHELIDQEPWVKENWR